MVLRSDRIIGDFELGLATEAPAQTARQQQAYLIPNDGVPFETHDDDAAQGIPSQQIDIFGTTKRIRKTAMEDLETQRGPNSPSQELAAITTDTRSAALRRFLRALK